MTRTTSDSDSDRRKDRSRKPSAPAARKAAESAPVQDRLRPVPGTRAPVRAAAVAADDTVRRMTTAAMRGEENEAVSRRSGQDYAEFREKCDSIRKLMAKMREQEDQPNPELKSEVALLLTDLKQLNRFDKFRTKWARDSVTAAKCKVDSFYLKLQNLMYEVVYVQKEIKRSLDYKSKAEDIDLDDLQTFLKDFYDDISPSEGQDEHQLMLTRLEWELQQRIKLADDLCKHEILNGENMENIRKKQELLARLRSAMSSVLESMAPMSADFSHDSEQNMETTETPSLTPVRVKDEAVGKTEAT